jgi:hypothetical protein
MMPKAVTEDCAIAAPETQHRAARPNIDFFMKHLH